MREIGKHGDELPESDCLVRCSDALRELVQRQPAVPTRGLEYLDHPIPIPVGETRTWRIVGRRRRHE
jgi:hypothetical protein